MTRSDRNMVAQCLNRRLGIALIRRANFNAALLDFPRRSTGAIMSGQNINFSVEAILVWLPEGSRATPENFEYATAALDAGNRPRAFDYVGRAIARAEII